jgi:glucokinase
MHASLLGIEIGGTKTQLVAGDAQGRIQARRRLEVARARGADGIRSDIEAALGDLVSHCKPSGIGVGFGGPVNWRTGRICCSHHIGGWSDFELGRWLSGLTGLPVAVDNDANVAALGEVCRGAGVGLNPVFYVTLGSGVGGGCVVDGRIYHGAVPGESEIGHVRLDRAGAIVEQRCSGWAVDRRVRALQVAEPSSVLAGLLPAAPGGEAKWLKPALEQRDPVALRLLEEVAQDLAFGLSHVVHLFHPAALILGGGLSLLGEPLRSGVAQALPAFVMQALHPCPEVRLAHLGEDAVPVGALCLAGQRTLS